MNNFALLSTRQEIDLRITAEFPPVEDRCFNYRAIDRRQDDPLSKAYAQGFGATPLEAVADLAERLEEIAEADESRCRCGRRTAPGNLYCGWCGASLLAQSVERTAIDHAALDAARLRELERVSGCYDPE